MKDFLVLEMPTFNPIYKKWKKYGYKNTKEKANLKAVLEKTTSGYCMYCFSRIRVDGKFYGDLEHAIEKKNSDKLVECVPNIGLACSVCNQSFKRIGEKKRIMPKNMLVKYEGESKCSVLKRKQCTKACKALRKLQEKYSELPDADIILQPMGVNGRDSKEKLMLQYNVLNMEFEPAKENHTYSEKDLQSIESHIKRFHLNDSQYRSRQLFEFLKGVIDNGGVIPSYEYNNMTVELFREKLVGKSKEEVLKICEAIYAITFPKM